MKVRSVSVLMILVLFIACGGRQEVFLDEEPNQPGPAAFELPDPIPASPAWVARMKKPASNKRLEVAGKTPGVAVLAPVSVKKVLVRGPAGRQIMRVAFV